MGYVTVTESVGEVTKTYHFSSYDDFKDWENNVSGVVVNVVVNSDQADKYGWIENPGYCPLPPRTLIDVEYRSGEVYESVYALEFLGGAEDWSIDPSKPDEGDIIKYRLVSE